LFTPGIKNALLEQNLSEVKVYQGILNKKKRMKINKLSIIITIILFRTGGEVRREGDDSSYERGSSNNIFLKFEFIIV
jgi:stalled ribosome alternative rescue factor ArfA